MRTVLSAAGQIEIPAVIREEDALVAGQQCEIERVSHGQYVVRVVGVAQIPERLNDVLRSCPVLHWWVEPERGELSSLEAPCLFTE